MRVEWFPSTSVDGGYYWHLVGGNGQIMGPSQKYTTAWSCRRTAKKVAKAFGCPLIRTNG